MKPRKQKNKQSRRPDVKRRLDDGRIQKKPQSKPTTKAKQNKNAAANQQRQFVNSIPFEPRDRILLVGEGDFSYSISLVENALVDDSNRLTCTSYDTEEQVYEKYPQSRDIILSLRESGQNVIFHVDATAEKKLPKAIRKRKGSFDVIIFNFPHTGGLTTDVARQIRANQELLVGFFNTVKPLLSRPEEKKKFVAPMALKLPTDGEDKYGSIAVTLFDGKPYDDWNIKELAKSCGLKTRRTFRFEAGLFKGYKHALTIGHRDREDASGIGSGMKNENKPARTYVFEAEDAAQTAGSGKSKKKKNKANAELDDSSDSD